MLIELFCYVVSCCELHQQRSTPNHAKELHRRNEWIGHSVHSWQISIQSHLSPLLSSLFSRSQHLRKCLLPQNISIQSHLNLMCLPFFSLSFVISANAYHIGKLPPPSWWEGRLIKRQKTLSQSIQIINLAINLRKDYLNLSSLETEKEQWDGNPNGKESHNRGRYKVFWMTVNYGRLTYRPYFLSTRSMRQKNYPNGFFSQFEIHQPNITF